MSDLIIVQKSLDERLTEYSCIFSESGKTITASEVRNVWCDFVEVTIKSTGGWQAFWKIPRATCGNLNIEFPTLVIVKVEEVNYRELSALVTILAAVDTVELPDQHEAMLFHLHPTVEQRDSSICIKEIAQCLDSLRFFYGHIWQPWDEEDDRSENWVTNRLEPRMKLFRDMQAGELSSRTVSHIRRLLNEAKSLHKQKLFLEEKKENQLSQSFMNGECFDGILDNDIALELMELKPRLEQVRREIEMMENPLLRKFVIERRQKEQPCVSDVEQYFIVWNGGNFEVHLNLMSKALSSIPDSAKIKPCSLMTALNMVEENDTVFLCQGVHQLNAVMNVMSNGNIKGFPSSSVVTLTSQEPYVSLIDWGGTRLMFSHIRFTAPVTKALMIVRSGVINAKNCQFICDSSNPTVTGICIMSGGTIELVDCDLSSFDAGVAVHSGGMLSLVNCRIASCTIGIQIYDGAKVYLKECIIQNCEEFGVVLRTFQNDFQDIVGSLELFDRCESIVVENCKMQNNKDGDVLISPMPSSESFLHDTVMESEEYTIVPVSNESDLELEETQSFT